MKILRKVVILSALIFLLGWYPLSLVLRSFIPNYVSQDIFYWIVLYSIAIAHFSFKLKAKAILFGGLILIAFGGFLSVVGKLETSESLLRFGYVFLLFGSFIALFEVVKHGSKIDK